MFRNLTVTVFFLLTASPAPATELQPCTGSNRQRIDCLEKNLRLVNSALDAVTKRTDAAVKSLREDLKPINDRITKLDGDALKNKDMVTLLSERNECVTWMTAGGEIKSRSCPQDPPYQNDMRWRLHRN